jgi:hypothetical protein
LTLDVASLNHRSDAPSADLPDVADALVCDGRVDRRVADGAMTHEDLQRPRVHAAPCQGIASKVAKYMGMDGKFEASRLAKPLDELLCAIDG